MMKVHLVWQRCLLAGMGIAVDLSGSLASEVFMPTLPENHFHHDFSQVGQYITAAIGVYHQELPEQTRQTLLNAAQLELSL